MRTHRPLHRAAAVAAAAAAAPARAVGLPTFALRRWRSACRRRAVWRRGARRSGACSRVAPAPPPGAPQGLHGEERACLNASTARRVAKSKLGAGVRNGQLMRSRAAPPADVAGVSVVVWHHMAPYGGAKPRSTTLVARGGAAAAAACCTCWHPQVAPSIRHPAACS